MVNTLAHFAPCGEAGNAAVSGRAATCEYVAGPNARREREALAALVVGAFEPSSCTNRRHDCLCVAERIRGRAVQRPAHKRLFELLGRTKLY